jgi:hypothetical protein
MAAMRRKMRAMPSRQAVLSCVNADDPVGVLAVN